MARARNSFQLLLRRLGPTLAPLPFLRTLSTQPRFQLDVSQYYVIRTIIILDSTSGHGVLKFLGSEEEACVVAPWALAFLVSTCAASGLAASVERGPAGHWRCEAGSASANSAKFS